MQILVVVDLGRQWGGLGGEVGLGPKLGIGEVELLGATAGKGLWHTIQS